MRWASPNPLSAPACMIACLLGFLAWSVVSALVSRGASTNSRHGDFFVLLACVAAYVLGGAREAGRTPCARDSEVADPERALKRFDELVQRGGRPDRVTFNAALDACSKLGRVAHAQRLFEQMPHYGLAPNANTYGILIRIYASGNMAKEAVDLFWLLRQEEVELSRHTYHDVIHCCVELQRIEDAVAVYDKMVRTSVLPRDITRQCLSQACRNRGWSRVADEIAQDSACVKKTEMTFDGFSEVSTELESSEADAESE